MFYALDTQSQLKGELTSFRPLRTAGYAFLYALAGKEQPQPWIFHLASVLCHGLAALLLFSMTLLLFGRQPPERTTRVRVAALLIALAFALHPVVSETVCWVKCLDDLMATVFVLAATRSLLRWNSGWRQYVAALLYFVLAVYSKESAVPLAVLVFFILYGLNKADCRRSLALTAPFLLVAAVYVAHRSVVLGRLAQCPPLSGTYGQTLVDMFPVVTEYLRLLCGIPPFCIDYNYMVREPMHRMFSSEVLGGLILLLLCNAMAIWLWRRPAFRLAALGWIWLCLFLLPVWNLSPTMQYMAERFLYLPLIGFLLAVGGSCLAWRRPFWTGAAAVLVLLIWTGVSCDRRGIWQDELTLFGRTSLERPGIKRVEENAAVAIFRLPQMRKLFIEDPLTGTVRMAPTLSREDAPPIIHTLQHALRLFPDNEPLLTALGFASEQMGRWHDAELLLQLAARQNPGSPECWFRLGAMYLAKGDIDKAREACAKALQLDSSHPEALRLQVNLRERQAKTPGPPPASK